MKRYLIALAALGPLALGVMYSSVGVRAQGTPTAAQLENYRKNVQPILADNCLGCHTSEAMGGLRLDSRDAILKGGKSGPAVVVGDPEKSLLIGAVRHTRGQKMPLTTGAAIARWSIAWRANSPPGRSGA